MLIGSIYYADSVFGKFWKKQSRIDLKRFKKEMPWTMTQVFVYALITSYVVAYFSCLYQNFYHSSWLSSGVVVSGVLFIGISATTVIIHNTLNQVHSKLIFITLGNRLLSLLAMGLIVGWLHP